MAVYLSAERPKPKNNANPVGDMSGRSILTINDTPSTTRRVNPNPTKILVHLLP